MGERAINQPSTSASRYEEFSVGVPVSRLG
jgi:hypothetical protein